MLVHPSGKAVADAAASLIADEVEAATGRFSLGLAGGSTPEQTYRALSVLNPDWSNVDAWLSDERWVGPTSDRSNGTQADRLLIGATNATFHRPQWGPDVDPEDSAAQYGRLLRHLHSDKHGPDLVMLGLGADGHTASLFPGSAALAESNHWFVANRIPESGEIRLTATYPLLATASTILFLVVGEAKAEALEASLAGKTPAGRVAT
ncbi:MAG: 6-phosphogluconolactonase, partial [Acidimicrobiia bacterium]|nr:6-phosphogluconolactonase [Acidimicrobiia bacterium]